MHFAKSDPATRGGGGRPAAPRTPSRTSEGIPPGLPSIP